MRLIAKLKGTNSLVNVTLRSQVTDLTAKDLNVSGYTHLTGNRSTTSGRLSLSPRGQYTFTPTTRS